MRARVLTQENMQKFQQTLARLKALSEESGLSTAELAIRFCVSNPNVTTVTTGIRTAKQAEQNAACAQVLPEPLLDRLNRL